MSTSDRSFESLPEYYRIKAEQNPDYETGLIPFTYDHSNREVIVNGSRSVALEVFDPATSFFQTEEEIDGIKITELPKHALYASAAMSPEYLATPLMHDWLRKHPETVENLRNIMMEVYQERRGSILTPQEAVRSGTNHGFDVVLAERGSLSLQVLGTCACLQVDEAAMQAENFEQRYGLYIPHNDFEISQQISLVCGLGAAAYMASS